jgi:hypothetical protein
MLTAIKDAALLSIPALYSALNEGAHCLTALDSAQAIEHLQILLANRLDQKKPADTIIVDGNTLSAQSLSEDLPFLVKDCYLACAQKIFANFESNVASYPKGTSGFQVETLHILLFQAGRNLSGLDPDQCCTVTEMQDRFFAAWSKNRSLEFLPHSGQSGDTIEGKKRIIVGCLSPAG